MYKFYYDESEHSRSITHDTVSADNFYDGFVTVIVGWSEVDEDDIAKMYADFEQRHENRKSGGEIKSTTIQQKHLAHGFATLRNANLKLVEDFLTLFDQRILVCICYQSKTEYIVEQLFRGYMNSQLIDADLMRYSIAKAVSTYQPKDVINAMYEKPSSLVAALKKFFYERIRDDARNLDLKRKEIDQFGQILMLLSNAEPVETLSWDYAMPFVGFKKYLVEMGIGDYSLVVDNEPRTEETARKLGVSATHGADSKSHFGLRMADMLVGILTKLMKALHEELRYHDCNEFVERRLVNASWFRIDDRRLTLYKKLYEIVVCSNNAWDKVYAGLYSDDLVMLLALLLLMDGSEPVGKGRATGEGCPEKLNTIACNMLEEHYNRIMDKGSPAMRAKTRPAISKAPLLSLSNGQTILRVLSAGHDAAGTPLALIDTGYEAKCYRLPNDLREWAHDLTRFAGSGVNPLPAYVLFTTEGSRHYVDIL